MLPTVSDPGAANAYAIIEAHEDFLKRHTGDVINDGDMFIINGANIVNNNLHYEVALSGYMPNGTAVTEAQALIILGYIHAYQATQNKEFLDRAVKFAHAYVDVFYQKLPPPMNAALWRCHWAVNGKQPFSSLGPQNYGKMSASGAIGAEIQFVDGVAQIGAGRPFFGDKLMRVYRVFSGKLSWRNVFSDLRTGTNYEIDYYVNVRGLKLRVDGSEIGATTEPVGKIVLTQPYTGPLLVNFATLTGPTIERNQPFEGWPMWSPVSREEFGNAVDAEQWAAEAFYLLHQETKDEYWLRCWEACAFTLRDFATLGSQDYYFIKTNSTRYVHTEGISYDWSYSTNNAPYTIGRDGQDGYIVVAKEAELFDNDSSVVALEQTAIINVVGPNTIMKTEVGSNSPTTRFDWMFSLRETLIANNNETKWRYSALSDGLGSLNNVETVNVRFDRLIQATKQSGDEYVTFDSTSGTPYNNAAIARGYQSGLLDARSDFFAKVSIANSSQGVVFGFWSAIPNNRPLDSITYRGGFGLAFKCKDANGDKYYMNLPESIGWTTLHINWSDLKPLNPGQQPATPTPGNITQFEIMVGDYIGGVSPLDLRKTLEIDLYAYGEIPPLYSGQQTFFQSFGLNFRDWNQYLGYVGDVQLTGNRSPDLKYTPGCFPFTTNYSKDKKKKDYWQGVPLNGYQHPVVWSLMGDETYYNNIVDFWFDGQEKYFADTGLMGPIAPVFVWPREDNLNYSKGVVNDFIYYLWGDQVPWAGYYSRAYYSACRLWHNLWEQGMPIPPKLVQVVERFATYLATFMREHDLLTPTVFPPAPALPYNDGWRPSGASYVAWDGSTRIVGPSAEDRIAHADHTGHMTAAFMAGSILVKLAGSTCPDLDYLIEGCMTEFERTQVVEHDGTTKHMSGSFSSWVGGNYYYGFWAGEIIRAMAFYIKYREAMTTTSPPGYVTPPAEDDMVATEDDSAFNVTMEDGSALLLPFSVANRLFANIVLEDTLYIMDESGYNNYLTME